MPVVMFLETGVDSLKATAAVCATVPRGTTAPRAMHWSAAAAASPSRARGRRTSGTRRVAGNVIAVRCNLRRNCAGIHVASGTDSVATTILDRWGEYGESVAKDDLGMLVVGGAAWHRGRGEDPGDGGRAVDRGQHKRPAFRPHVYNSGPPQ